MSNLQIVERRVSELEPYARNSRTHSAHQVSQIANSIREFGFTNPLLIDERGGIIAGHGRLMAAKRLGMEAVPCIVLAGLSEAQKRALVIADNQLALNADWDEELLAAEIAALSEMDFDTSLLGFDDEEIDRMIAEALGEDAAANMPGGDVPEPRNAPVTQPGDLWLLGRHQVLCGNSTSIDDVSRIAPQESIDCLITDPPYNVAYEGKTVEALTIENDSMSDAEFRQFLIDAFTAADVAMKRGAAFYIWHADSEGFNFRGACRDVGWTVRQCLVWVKNVMVLGRQDYQWRHEPCLYGWKGGATHKWCGDRKRTTVLEFEKPARNGEHPTMKPVDLIEHLLMNSTLKGDVVLDLFGGSGSTLIACEKSGRDARLVEIDPRYVDVIIRRWQDFTGKQAVLESTGQTFDEVSETRGG